MPLHPFSSQEYSDRASTERHRLSAPPGPVEDEEGSEEDPGDPALPRRASQNIIRITGIGKSDIECDERLLHSIIGFQDFLPGRGVDSVQPIRS